jgi:hypothetical protein
MKSAFLCHRVLYQADYGHKNGAANAATGDVAYYCAQVQRAAASRRTSHYALEKRPSEAATNNSRDRIAGCAQAVLFHCCAGDVATDGTADCFNNETNDVHSLDFDLSALVCIRTSADKARRSFFDR